MIHRNQQRISIHANHYNYLIKASMNIQELNRNYQKKKALLTKKYKRYLEQKNKKVH